MYVTIVQAVSYYYWHAPSVLHFSALVKYSCANYEHTHIYVHSFMWCRMHHTLTQSQIACNHCRLSTSTCQDFLAEMNTKHMYVLYILYNITENKCLYAPRVVKSYSHVILWLACGTMPFQTNQETREPV